MLPIIPIPRHLLFRPKKKKQSAITRQLTPLFNQRLFIDPQTVEGLSDFLQKYPGKVFITGPEKQMTCKEISNVIQAYKKILDAEKEEISAGIYSQGDLTLCYKCKAALHEHHSLWL